VTYKTPEVETGLEGCSCSSRWGDAHWFFMLTFFIDFL